jgi:hypothetical protein
MADRVDLFKDARHRGQVGRFDLQQLGDYLLGIAAEIGQRAAEVERCELNEQRERVGKGEVEIGELVVLDLPDSSDHVDDGAVVAVGEHAALGRAGGAGGVDEGEGVLGTHARAAPFELLGRAGSSALAYVRQGDRAQRRSRGGGAVRLGLLGGRVDRDHRAQIRQAIADGGDLRDLLLVLTGDRASPGVADHPVALLGRVGRVDRHDDQASRGGGHVQIGPLGSGVGEDCEALAGLEPQVDQAEADLLHDAGKLGIAHVVPLAIALVAHRGLLAVGAGRVRDQIGDRTGLSGRRRSGLHGALLLNFH